MINNNNLEEDFDIKISDQLSQGFEEQIAKAIQVLNEKDEINSRTAFVKVQEKINQRNNAKVFIRFLIRAAAILFVPLLIASALLLNRQMKTISNTDSGQSAFQEIKSPPGVRSKIILPDGTKAWLNSESTIKYAVPFNKNSREVTISGEAFFDVKKNARVPFVVKSGNTKVTVLGTRFNYKAYENDGNIEIVLEEGEIKLSANKNNFQREKLMKPGERAIVDKTTGIMQVINEPVYKYIAWYTEKLVFDETPMPEVATQLGRWYGIEVIIQDPAIRKYRITTTFENESLHQVLELLRLSSPIEIKYISATIDKLSLTQTKSKVIFTKKNLK